MTTSPSVYLAFDLGASSGRAILGTLQDGVFRLEEICRFPNYPTFLRGRAFWDFLGQWNHVRAALRLCVALHHTQLAGIGVDTWGCDFGLLGEDGQLLANPMCYRDALMDGMDRTIANEVPPTELYEITGWPPARVSTLSELVALKRGGGDWLVKNAATLLMMPDLFRYFLCGQKAVELTAAGSGQALDLRRRTWCSQVFKKLGLPTGFLPEIIAPAQIAGPLSEEIASATGMSRVPVIAVMGHDTASAAAAAPDLDDQCALISCGTWSVVGMIQDSPVTSADAMRRGFVNESGLDSILFVKNFMGLHLFEGLHRALAAANRRTTYAQMIESARQARPFGCYLAVDAPPFFCAHDAETSVREFLQKTGQETARGMAALLRAILEGLAWQYRFALADLSDLTGKNLKRISLVGGGSRNGLLCQMVADATGLEVIAGPAEAAAAGNLAAQALATGQIGSAAEIRPLLRRSFRRKTYRPEATSLWDKNVNRYQDIRNSSHAYN